MATSYWPNSGGTVRTIGQRGGMQTQPVGSPVELNQGGSGYGNPYQPKYPGYQAPLEPNADDQTRTISGSWGGPMWQGSPQDRMLQMGQAQGAYQQAPLGRIGSSPMPQWGQGMMLGSPFSPMRQQMGQAQQTPQAQQSSAYSGGLGQLAGRAPWPPQGFTGLVR